MNGYNDELRRAAECLREAERIVVFTGAGVSAESGIPTFRDDDGLWREFPPEHFGSWRGILGCARREPRRLANFVRAVLGPIATAAPNAAHQAIAQLQDHADVTVITQNIDGLHQLAGSKRVYEIHGSLFETILLSGRNRRTVRRADTRTMLNSLQRVANSQLPHLQLALAVRPLLGVSLRGVYRPAVVLFGEGLPEPAWSESVDAARSCDVMISVGTSSTVLPAAFIPHEAKSVGAKTIMIDPAGGEGDFCLKAPAAFVLPELLEAAFG